MVGTRPAGAGWGIGRGQMTIMRSSSFIQKARELLHRFKRYMLEHSSSTMQMD